MSEENAVQASQCRTIEDAEWWAKSLDEHKLHGIAAAFRCLAKERDRLRSDLAQQKAEFAELSAAKGDGLTMYAILKVKYANLEKEHERLTEAFAKLEAQEPVAEHDEIEFSRYCIRWTNGPLPVGTKFYVRPVVVKQASVLDIDTRLRWAYDHIQHEAYNDALSSILEARDRLASVDQNIVQLNALLLEDRRYCCCGDCPPKSDAYLTWEASVFAGKTADQVVVAPLHRDGSCGPIADINAGLHSLATGITKLAHERAAFVDANGDVIPCRKLAPWTDLYEVATPAKREAVEVPEGFDAFLDLRAKDSYSCRLLVRDIRAMLAASQQAKPEPECCNKPVRGRSGFYECCGQALGMTERRAAEDAYRALPAVHDEITVTGGIGSRDFCLFLLGWNKRAALASSQEAEGKAS